jgi:son of sevenless-like protein
MADDYSEPVLVLQALTVPWYLKPQFAVQLDVDADGQVRNGTIPALVERLMGTLFRFPCLKFID